MKTVTIPQALAFDLFNFLCPANTKEKGIAYNALGLALQIEEVDAFLTYCENTELRNTQVVNLDEQESLDPDGNFYAQGWYYWYCLPGCLPDSEPYGPYLSHQGATLAAYSEQYESEL